jgi:hypothetical protein
MFGQRDSDSAITPAGGFPPGEPPPLYYYWQLPFDPTNIVNRFFIGGGYAGGYCRVIKRGEVVRSFEVNANSQVAGDMRLLGANPIQTGTNWPGDAANLFVRWAATRTTTRLCRRKGRTRAFSSSSSIR